ncbi:MAG: TolC family protein [Gemmatimonadota bacterium]|nr:TolC family protein [Gemmatimonadota bacterium]MDE2864759.1 TolC family protein [Gemmatimonadota bacterium]MXV96064.1 TolC family protein [Gemmatimonadota bacterium]MYE16894.1 TolC family protein [Gemmatimonadota bacterium]
MRAVAVGVALGLVVVAGVGGVAAQSAGVDQEVTVLTLREALERASQFNPQYRQALNRMELEGPQRREAWGAFLPDLRVSYGTSQRFSRQRTAVDFFGNPIDNEVIRTITTSNSSHSASAGLDLFRGGERFHGFQRAQAQARVERLSAERDLNTVLAEVQGHFVVAQRQKARLAVEEELLVSRERDYQVAEQRFELASIGRSDLYAANLDLEQQRLAVREARGQAEKAMLALRRAIGDRSLRLVDVDQQLPQPFDPVGLDVAALVQRAVEQSPRVGAAEAARSVTQSELGSARASRWPSLSLNSNFYGGASGSERSALFDLDTGDFYATFGLNVSIPLFTRFQTSRQIASASVNLRNAGEEVRAAELQLEEEVTGAYVDLETAWANVRLQETVLEVARERLRIVEEEYRLATKGIEDLRAAIREEAEAQRDLVQQRFEFAAALLQLHTAAGIVAEEAGLSTTREQD